MNTIKGIGAVLAGIVTIVVTHTATDYVLESLGIFTKPDQGFHITWMVVTATIYRCLYTVLGGYVTAALAPNRPMFYAVILGLIGVAGKHRRCDSNDTKRNWAGMVSDSTDRPCSALYVVRWKTTDQITETGG